MADEPYFIGLNDEGDEVRFDVICAFDSEETGKSYLIYAEPRDGAPILCSIYEIDGEELKLRNLETDEDQEIVDDLLGRLNQKG